MSSREQRSLAGGGKLPLVVLGAVCLLQALVGRLAASPGGEPGADETRPTSPQAAVEEVLLDADELGGSGEQAVIRRLYATLEEALARSGDSVSFLLDDFRTYRPGDFAETLVLDVLTVRPALELQVMEGSVGGPRGPAGRYFEATWREGFSPEERSEVEEWLERFAEMTLAELYGLPDTDADHRNIAALTSYRVQVSFDERSESYRAIAKWVRRPHLSAGKTALLVEDHVTECVHCAIAGVDDVWSPSQLHERALEPTPAAGMPDGEPR